MQQSRCCQLLGTDCFELGILAQNSIFIDSREQRHAQSMSVNNNTKIGHIRLVDMKH